MTVQRLGIVGTMLVVVLIATPMPTHAANPSTAQEGLQANPDRRQEVTLRANGLANRDFRDRFKKLSAEDVIEMKGRRMTKAQFLDAMGKKIRDAQARVESKDTAGSRTRLETLRSQFIAQQNAELAQENERTRANFARVAGQWQAAGRSRAASTKPISAKESIRREAADLIRRSRTASADERADIEKRVQELVRRAKRIGR
jgi:hypothetical protein